MASASIKDLFSLKGKVGIVTGAHAWLGYDMACALAEAGCDIIVTSRKQDSADETAEKIKKEYKVDTLGIQMDQRFHDQVKAMAEKANKWKGHIDILINNAGGGSGATEGNLLKRDPQDIINMITTNLIGALLCCREVAAFMVRQGHGKIINIASGSGVVGRDRRIYDRNKMNQQPVDYGTSKAGVIGMTRDLAALFSPQGIYVNSISPGGFDKGNLPEGFVKDYSDKTMLGRMGRMGIDIKGAALFLASPASDYITGHNLMVDGGFTAWK